MYRSYQFLVKVMATSTGKLLDSLYMNDAVAELCSGKFNVANRRNYQQHRHQHHQVLCSKLLSDLGTGSQKVSKGTYVHGQSTGSLESKHHGIKYGNNSALK
jgi:hypothetical protein